MRYPVVALIISLASIGSFAISRAQDAPALPPATRPAPSATNLALFASPSTSFVSGHERLEAINDGYEPRAQDDHSHGAYGNWPRNGTQWVQYDWSKPIHTDRVDIYWWTDGGGIKLPTASRLLYWDGHAFLPVKDAQGLGLEPRKYNTTTFAPVTTSRLRLEFDSSGTDSTGILEWKVYDAGNSPKFAPIVKAGVDRIVVVPGKTYLQGFSKGVQGASDVLWAKESGPGDVSFDTPNALSCAARVSSPGDYVLRLTVRSGELSASDTVALRAEMPPPAARLQPIHTRRYAINSPMWNARMKPLIVNWLPHCIEQMSNPNVKEGGIQNFEQAGNKLAGRPFKPQVGAVFANAWVHNTVEAMCIALQVDPQGDPQIIAAQKQIREKLDAWVPLILSAQEPDGYLQTWFTLDPRKTPRWTVRTAHEGYLAGYFMEAAIAHYLLTEGADRRMLDAAIRLADCWVNNIGPAPKKTWYDGHQELEMALVRLARFVNEVDGGKKGDKYIELAKFLMEARGNGRGGEEYDQSHLPVTRQYEAVGHAVRAIYSYAGMADVAAETADRDYQSAVRSLWDNITHRKYYITGGIGSGETSEGFGKNYSLPNNAYCESCSNCGQLFFNFKLHLAYHESKYADLYEETLFNAILGDFDLQGKNFYYTNSLDSSGARYPWHVCPCCVGNFPRTLLSLPTWMYTNGGTSGLYVNLYLGSTVNVGKVAAFTAGGGVNVSVTQTTDYPWSGNVALTMNPERAAPFDVRLRVPDRSVSTLYSDDPGANGITSLAVNGTPITPQVEKGYAVIRRTWNPGDKIELVLPMKVQRIKAVDKIVNNRERVALKYGPLVFNIESVDQNINNILNPDAPLTTAFRPDLLGGTLVIQGNFADGSPLLAIPNYLRLNRGGRSIVWIRDR